MVCRSAAVVYTISYAAFRSLNARQGRRKPITLSAGLIFGYLVSVGVANFIVRMIMPVGEEWLSLKLGYFPAYIALFLGGIAAYRGKWLEQLHKAAAKKWLYAVIAISIIIPIVKVLGAAIEGNVDRFKGVITWQSMFYSSE